MKEIDLRHGDGLAFLDSLAEDSCELAFVDPPFNLNKKYAEAQDNLKEDEYWAWTRLWLDKVVRAVRPGGSIFVHHIPRWLVTIGGYLNEKAEFRHWITWDASSGPMGKSLQPNHYGVLYYIKPGGECKFYPLRVPNKRCRNCGFLTKDFGGKKHTIPAFGPLLSDVWSDIFRVKHQGTRTWRHPCELPVPLMERILLMASDAGDLVIDPFFGSGTTAVACKRMGRRFAGCEMSDEYRNVAATRVESAPQSVLAGKFVSMWPDNHVLSLREEDLPQVAKDFVWPEVKQDLDFFRPHLAKSREKGTRAGKKNSLTGGTTTTILPPYSLTAGTRDSKSSSVKGAKHGNDDAAEVHHNHHPADPAGCGPPVHQGEAGTAAHPPARHEQ